MHSFQEYMSSVLHEQSSGYGYVAVRPDAFSLSLLEQIIRDAGVKNTIDLDELHLTLAYDANNPLFDINSSDEVINASLSSVKILGDDALVIMLDSDDARERNIALANMGFESAYPRYIPHISLKYGAVNDEDLSRLQSVFVEYKGKDIRLCDEIWEPCHVTS